MVVQEYRDRDNSSYEKVSLSTDPAFLNADDIEDEDEDTSRLLPPTTPQQLQHKIPHVPLSRRLGRTFISSSWARFIFLWVTAVFLLPCMFVFMRHHRRAAAEAEKVAQEKQVWYGRAEQVKAAFVHAYGDYERIAFPHDELRPLTNGTLDSFNGWAVTAVDSLDTMLLMNLTGEFDRAMRFVRQLDFAHHDDVVPFFETVIRYLGGLLSTYHLSLTRTSSENSEILLKQANALGYALLPAFSTPHGFPAWGVNPVTGETSIDERMGPGYSLAESGSCQMEYKYLAHLTGNPEYFKVVDKVTDGLIGIQDNFTQLWTHKSVDAADGNGVEPMGGFYTMGAYADSAYEYFLKQYLLSGRTEHKLLELYLTSIRGAIKDLLFLNPTRNLLYTTAILVDPAVKDHTHYIKSYTDAQHLACFFPGLLALGAHALGSSPDMSFVFPEEERKLHLSIAEGLATTCWLNYADMSTGLGPDVVTFEEEGQKHWWDVYEAWEKEDVVNRTAVAPGLRVDVPIEKDAAKRGYTVDEGMGWYARPETLESMFILYRVTGNPLWRDRAWQIFASIEEWSKGPVGYASVKHVDGPLNLDSITANLSSPHLTPFFKSSNANWKSLDNETDSAGPTRLDHMPSFFLAETLKYLYLLFHPDSETMIPLDEYVFNTEAHPLPIYSWSATERDNFGVGKGPEVKVAMVPLVS